MGVYATLEEALLVWTLIEPDPDVMRLVAGLRATVPVALATNQQSYRAAFMSERLGYSRSFDHLLFSCDLGHAKPSGEFFAECVTRLEVTAGETLLVDDHEENVDAARKVRLHAERFHLSEGPARLTSILRQYGLDFS